jgi:hypothetical protein
MIISLRSQGQEARHPHVAPTVTICTGEDARAYIECDLSGEDSFDFPLGSARGLRQKRTGPRLHQGRQGLVVSVLRKSLYLCDTPPTAG